MTECDFSPVDESDTPGEIADSVLALFATPQPVIAPEWVMLTDKELDKVVFDCGLCRTSQDIAKAIQAAFIAKQGGAA